MSQKLIHPAETYNKVKGIVFSIFARDGYEAALKSIEKNRWQLDTRGVTVR